MPVPGYLVSVGYMDPGNWATDLAGGSKFGYTLLSVILLSNLMAILLQALAARLGIVTGRDLAQACRATYSRPVNFMLWVACEVAIIACDLAEVIGTAIALKLLFGIPAGRRRADHGARRVPAAAADEQGLSLPRGLRHRAADRRSPVCFAIQIAAAAPPVAAMLEGFVPSTEIVTNPEMLYIAIGIIGATVMPHNLYLHSSIVQTRAYERTDEGRRDAIKWATTDSTIALMLALFINAAILIVAAATFHASGHADVAEIGQAYELLSPLLGLSIASTLFAVALLASGLNSTVTATLAGQIVMEGFLHLRLPNWARRLLTRGIAIVPVIIVTALYGERGTGAAAGAQPGDPVDAAAVRGDSAGAVRVRPAQDGPVRDLAAGRGRGLDRRRHHRGPEPETAVRDVFRVRTACYCSTRNQKCQGRNAWQDCR